MRNAKCRAILLGAIALALAGCGSSGAASAAKKATSRVSNPAPTVVVPNTGSTGTDTTTSTTAPVVVTTTSPTSASTSNTNPNDGQPVPAGDMGGLEQTYAVGQTGTLFDTSDNVPLATISVSPPAFSTSDADGDTPQFGYFATFQVTVTDIAPVSTQDDISPSDTDFYVQTPDGQRYGDGSQSGVQSGNTPDASTSSELGTDSSGGSVDLFPGQSTTGTVVIDVPSEHGQIVDTDGSIPYGAWNF